MRAKVLGIDQSVGMLDQTRKRLSVAGMADHVRFAAMDAEALDLEGSSFDAVLSLYVVRHLPNPAAAMAEMWRVLKPGGKVVIATGARPNIATFSGFREGLNIATDRMLEKAGRAALSPKHLRQFLVQQDISIVHSHAAHAEVDLATLLRKTRFRTVKRHWWSKRYELSANEFWQIQSVFDSAARSALAAVGSEGTDHLRERYLAHLQAKIANGLMLIYRTGANINVAER